MTPFPSAPNDRPPRQAALPAVATALAVAVLAAFVTVGGAAQSLNLAWGLWFAEILISLALPWVMVARLGVAPARLTGVDAGGARLAGLGLLFGAVNYAAWAVPLMALAQAFFPAKVVELFDSSGVFKHQTPVETAIIVAGVGLAAPLCEEFFFRGVLQRALYEKFDPPTAIVITALVFAAFHLDPVGLLARFEMGVLFGLLAWRSGSLWPAIAAHSANNLVSTAIFFGTGAGNEGELPWQVPAAALLVGNAAMLGLLRLSRGRLASARPAEVVERPPPPWGRLLGPWLLFAGVMVAGLLAVDWRGVQLGLFDATHPLSSEQRKDEGLYPLRQRARRGQVPLEAYEAYRIRLQGEGPSVR